MMAFWLQFVLPFVSVGVGLTLILRDYGRRAYYRWLWFWFMGVGVIVPVAIGYLFVLPNGGHMMLR